MRQVRTRRDHTTGEVAKICGLSQKTIIRCCDQGQLKSYRVPGSKFRRITREAVLEFMREYGIPATPEEPTAESCGEPAGKQAAPTQGPRLAV